MSILGSYQSGTVCFCAGLLIDLKSETARDSMKECVSRTASQLITEVRSDLVLQMALYNVLIMATPSPPPPPAPTLSCLGPWRQFFKMLLYCKIVARHQHLPCVHSVLL